MTEQAVIVRLLAMKAQKASQKCCSTQEAPKLKLSAGPEQLGVFVPLSKTVQQSGEEPQELYLVFTFSYFS